MIYKIKKKNNKIVIMWVPSHIGIKGNERADKAAKEGAMKKEIDYDFGISVISVFYRKKEGSKNEELDNINLSFASYNRLNKIFGPIVNNSKIERRIGISYARIKLGYKYIWEYTNNNEYCNKCRICKKEKGHTLEHYLRECPIIGKYRGKNEIVGTLESEAERFLNIELLGEILENHPGFVKGF